MGISYNVKKVEGELNQKLYTPSSAFSYEIEPLNTKSANLLGHASRYATTNIMLFKSGGTQVRIPQPWIVPKMDGNGRSFVVTTRTQFKPERIAHMVYGDSTKWWIIMRANNLIDVEQLRAGMTINIPNFVR